MVIIWSKPMPSSRPSARIGDRRQRHRPLARVENEEFVAEAVHLAEGDGSAAHGRRGYPGKSRLGIRALYGGSGVKTPEARGIRHRSVVVTVVGTSRRPVNPPAIHSQTRRRPTCRPARLLAGVALAALCINRGARRRSDPARHSVAAAARALPSRTAR